MALFWIVILMFNFFSKALCGESVADYIGPHMIRRIADYLTVAECQEFYQRLTRPKEDLGKQINNYFPGPDIDVDILTEKDCRNTLKEWMENKGDTVYWDQFLNDLYMVGRDDLASALVKDINQGVVLALKKYVADFHRDAMKIKSPLLVSEDESLKEESVLHERVLKNFDDGDWEFLVEREQLPPFDRTLTEWLWPVFYGLLIGFFGGAIVCVLTFVLIVSITGLDNVDNLDPKLLINEQEAKKNTCKDSSNVGSDK